MRRIHLFKIDTPEWYEKVWTEKRKTSTFDTVRMKALIKTVKNGDKVLDIGAGIFGAAQFIAQKTNLKCDLYAVDYSPISKKITEEECPDIKYFICEATKLPLIFEEKFDVVIAGELIEHIERPFDLVREMARVCKYNGWLVISTLNTRCKKAKQHEYPEHIWDFTPEDLIKLFKPFGITQYKLVGNYHVIYCQKKIDKFPFYIIDADDFCEDYNCLDVLFKIKANNPKFKINLFTIPGRCSESFIKEVKKLDWIDLLPHGLFHQTNYECQDWDYDTCVKYLQTIEKYNFTKVFKAPGWLISDAMYKALLENNYAVADQEYNNDRRPPELKCYLLNQPNRLHFHTHKNGVQNYIGDYVDYLSAINKECIFIKNIL